MTADFWLRLALAALTISGVWAAFGADMIFDKLGKWAEKRFPKWLTMPTFVCPICMSSFWGSGVWFFAGGDVSPWWPAFVLALAGAMKIMVGTILKDV